MAGEAVPKTIDTSALRKDLLQIDGVYARISKFKYALYELTKRTDLNYVALGVVMACKNKWKGRMKIVWRSRGGAGGT